MAKLIRMSLLRTGYKETMCAFCFAQYLLFPYSLWGSYHVVSFPVKGLTWQGAEGCLMPTASKKMNSDNWMGLEINSPHSSHQMRPQPLPKCSCNHVRELEAVVLSQAMPGFLIHRNCEIKYVIDLKSLPHFGGSCYGAFINGHFQLLAYLESLLQCNTFLPHQVFEKELGNHHASFINKR